MTKRWQKTVKCPRCNTGNLIKARKSSLTGNITFSVDVTRMCCWNCGEALRSSNLPYPFGDEGN